MNHSLETTDELCEQIADWIGVYGCCKSTQNMIINKCEFDSNPLCCRLGFIMELKDRIKNAAENDLIEHTELTISNNIG